MNEEVVITLTPRDAAVLAAVTSVAALQLRDRFPATAAVMMGFIGLSESLRVEYPGCPIDDPMLCEEIADLCREAVAWSGEVE